MIEVESNTHVKMGSDKSFGLIFAIVFLLIGLFPLLGLGQVRFWALAVAAVFAGLAYLRPAILRPLNLVWFRFGLLLHKIVSPIIMGILFFLTVTPTGLIMRLLGKDPLSKAFDPAAQTYWIEVTPEQKSAKSMRNQF